MTMNIETPMTTESELRNAVIDRLIAASLSECKPAWEATLEQWRTITSQKTMHGGLAPRKMTRA